MSVLGKHLSISVLMQSYEVHTSLLVAWDAATSTGGFNKLRPNIKGSCDCHRTEVNQRDMEETADRLWILTIDCSSYSAP